MPGTFSYEGVLYRWNKVSKQVEKVDVKTTPIAKEDCPKEVLLGLLEISGDLNQKEEI